MENSVPLEWLKGQGHSWLERTRRAGSSSPAAAAHARQEPLPGETLIGP